MKQSAKESAEKLRGKIGFDTYYERLFGSRWQRIKTAFLSQNELTEWNACGKESYFLDPASVKAAATLPLKGAKKILDMCAAPGGKTIVLSSLMDSGALLTANERSLPRKIRLEKSVSLCLPDEIKKRIIITNEDASRLCLNENNVFDRILLDAPCSSERHVFRDEKYLAKWSPARIRSLSASQWSLLSSAFRMLLPGGFLLYCTCALTYEENDGVISRLLGKFTDASIISPSEETPRGIEKFCSSCLPASEQSRFAFRVLPDPIRNTGPIFYCLIKKRRTADSSDSN